MKTIATIFFSVFLIFSFKLNASYRAAEISYKWLYGYTYKISFTTYTSASITLDKYCQIDSICFGDGTRGSLLRVNGLCNGPCSPACEGDMITPTIKMNVYETTHTYAGPGNYIMCFNDGNRNQNIINIPNSVNHGISLQCLLVIPTFGLTRNNSPDFFSRPLAEGCLNNGCFYYTGTGVDADDDSLSYEIVPCMSAYGAQIPGYSFPFSGTGGAFSINSTHGILNWCDPQINGLYNVVILVKEWRKNADGIAFLVGYVQRDIQFTISTCTNINEFSIKNDDVIINPNPVIKNFNISFNQNKSDLFNIQLLDITGRLVKILATNSNITPQTVVGFNIEEIETGIYFLKISDSNQSFITKKIIKQ